MNIPAQPEEITVITGALKVLLPGAPNWQMFIQGEKFFVHGHSEFNLQVSNVTSYLCRYLSK